MGHQRIEGPTQVIQHSKNCPHLTNQNSAVRDHAPTTAYRSADSQLVYISRTVESDDLTPVSSPSGTPQQASPLSVSTPSSIDAQSPTASGERSKVPRPPNAFILYRKHYHPILKDQNPDMHNNDISIILGKQWNQEAENVKNEYRARAEKIKKKHALDNPGYQYAPRKPSEKKRRMTTKKLAQLRATASEDPKDQTMNTTAYAPSAAQTVGVVRANDAGALSSFAEDSDQFSFNLPIPQGPMHQQLINNQRITPQENLISFDDALQQAHIATASTSTNLNEQSFLNTLIDWDGLRQDQELIFGADAQEAGEIASAELGGQEEQEEFVDEELQAELERLARWL